MKSRWIFALVLALFMAVFPMHIFAQEAFVITSYQIEMEVHEDNRYDITETLDVSYKEQRHGILRTLPQRDYMGQQVEISDVTVEGYPFQTSKQGDNLEIKIGDSKRFAREEQTYVLSYTWHGKDDGMEDRDELYFNLVGTSWDCPVEKVRFVIRMPKDFDESKMHFTYGVKGSTAKAPLDVRLVGKTITGELLEDLSPGEGLTIALPLPQGYFSRAPKAGVLGNSFVGWVMMGLLAACSLILWATVGRRKKIFPTVEFYPPEGISSADAGYLMNGEVESLDITSLLIYWADKGYLSIQVQEEKKIFGKKTYFLLRKLKDMGDESKEYERKMFSNLFEGYGDGCCVSTLDLEKAFYATVEEAKQEVRNQFSGEARVFSPWNGAVRWALRLSAVGICATAFYFFDTRLQGVIGGEAVVAACIGALSMILPLFFVIALGKKWKTMHLRNRLMALLVVLLWVGIAGRMQLFLDGRWNPAWPVCFSLGAAFLLLLLSVQCQRRTKLGQSYLEYLTGFKDFLEAAERDRIEMLVAKDPQYLYHILPYAVVLGVTDAWAEELDSIAVEPPRWYVPATPYSGFRISAFTQDLGGSLNFINDQFTSKPASSGNSSGGGSSGGGSGGGGGSSW